MLTAVVLLGAGDAVGVGFSTRTETWIYDQMTDVRSDGGTSPVTSNSAGSASNGAVQTSAQGYASSQVGGIHLTAISSSQLTQGPTHSGSPDHSTGFARGDFSDAFVLAGANIAPGSTGVATVAFSVSGSLGGSGQGGAVNGTVGRGAVSQWLAFFSLNAPSGGVDWRGYQELYVDFQTTQWSGDAVPGTYVFDLPVVFGETLNLAISGVVEARTGVGASSPGPAFAEANAVASFGSTMAWGGILALIDASGAPITGFTAISPDTGFDYVNAYSAVPEPGTSALLLASLVGLAGARQRRPRS